MRIVFFIDHLRHDGAQRALKLLTEGLLERGHTIAIVAMDADQDTILVDSLRRSGAEVRRIGRIPLLLGYGLLSTWLWMRARNFDVAVTMLFIADVFARPLARLAQIPRLIASIRARNVHYPPWKRLAVRTTMPLVDRVVVNSEGIRAFAQEVEGAPPEQTCCIPNAVMVEQYQHSRTRSELLSELRFAPNRRIIGSVGRLAHQKGFDLLLKALATIDRQNVDLVLFGEGEDEPILRALAEELDIAERVRFAGYRHDLPHVFGALDIYAHPARFEGMPNAVLEAMAAGCAIVATAIDGNRELIEDGVHGWLVPPEDPRALACAISAALADSDEADRRGMAAQERAAHEFSTTAMVDAWEQVLTEQRDGH